jgi:glycosyltransferase involved in cell wall biosynthesis
VLVLGDSNDGTEYRLNELAKEFPGKLKIIPTTWETKNQSGGSQLKLQTDQALAECTGDWCLYLQADEVLHEVDYPRIREALAAAEGRSEVEGIVFDWLHFYGDYDHVIKGRSWYRREVRIIRNGCGIESFRDAQGFRKNGRRLKAIASGARVFHYGHVQSVDSNRARREGMATWWGEDPNLDHPKLEYFCHTGLRKFTESHPPVMAERLRDSAACVNPETRPRVWTLKEWRDRVTLLWESLVPYRIGEFRNYDFI